MREAIVERNTKETQIKVKMNLDEPFTSIKTDVGFFTHMLELMSFHGSLGLDVEAHGDIEVCDHHEVEDTGILLGDAFKEALGDKKGINRYGNAVVPMDETLAQVNIDISGRPYCVFHASFVRDSIGNFSTEMVKEFMQAFATHAGITLHVNVLYGDNDHHKIEAIFKALGRAIKDAALVTSDEVRSTKGVL